MRDTAENVLCCVIDALEQAEDRGIALDDYLDFHLKHPELRRTVSNILFQLYRHRRMLDRRLAELAPKPPKPILRRVLLATMTQIYFCDAIAPESAVNVAVTWVRALRGKPEAGFVNAVLRRARERVLVTGNDPASWLPPALLKRWQTRYTPEIIRQLTDAFATEPGNTFRCRIGGELTPEECETLQAAPLPPAVAESPFRYYTVADPGKILNHPDWMTGRFYFQDPATAGAIGLIDFSRVKRALDLCAAPGGKSLMIAELLPPTGVLVAADRSAKRQELTRENFRRFGFERHRIVVAEPWDFAAEMGTFDLVLADVPCSNTGVYRRRPDALWRFKAQEQPELQALQRRILDAAAARVAPGGQLVYSTCSIEPEENAVRIDEFLSNHPEFAKVRDAQLLPSPMHDGAYSAVLAKQES